MATIYWGLIFLLCIQFGEPKKCRTLLKLQMQFAEYLPHSKNLGCMKKTATNILYKKKTQNYIGVEEHNLDLYMKSSNL